MTAASRRFVLGILLALGLCIPTAAVELSSVGVVTPLKEWSTVCNPGFRLSAMPNAWSFVPGRQALVVTTRVAIDFEELPDDVYTVSINRDDGERFFDLKGFDFMALEAEIRSRATGRVIRILPGVYSMRSPKAPVVFSWDGLRRDGKPVRPGFYEIEVKGRFVPTWAGIRAADGYTYGDLEGWSIVEEACRRALTIEVVEKVTVNESTRGAICAAPPASYYSTVDATNSTTLRATLHPVIDDHTRFPYSSTSTDTWDVLNDADEDPSNPSQLLSIYKNQAYADGCSSGCTWNREHTWAKSFGFSVESGNGRIPYTDCHHLRAANVSYNSSRGNKLHNDCPGCTTYATDANNGFGGGVGDVNRGSGGSTYCGFTPTPGDAWETWDHRKGDVARTILYMDIRYEGGTGALGGEQDLIATSDLALMMVETTTCGDGYQDPAYHGVLSTLLAWHGADPVDSDELRRNDQVWCYQGNRNPFVDHPEWVDCLYNNNCSGAGPTFGGIDAAADLDSCADTGVQIDWTLPTDWNDGCVSGCSRGFTISRDGVAITTGGCAGTLAATATSCVDTTGTNGTSSTYRVEAFNNAGNTSDGGTTAAAGDFVDDAIGPVITTGPSALASSNAFTAEWTTDEPSDSYLEWGSLSGSYPNSTSDATNVSAHSLTATGLALATTYYYRVCSTDPCGNGPTCSAEATVTTTGVCDPGTNIPVFINELHYDNAGNDTGEFVEIAGPAGTDLGLGPWKVELYNGSDGSTYDTISLSGVIDDEGTGYGALSFARVGIQNGAPDGLALVDGTGVLVQFLCYEGVMIATDGTAVGVTCTDIGVFEDAAPVGDTLQLTGGPGFVYSDFSWSGPVAGNPGSLNSSQTMLCGGSGGPIFGGIDAAADVDVCAATGVRIDWTTPTDWNDGCSSGCGRTFTVYRDLIAISAGGCAGPLAEASVSCVDTGGVTGTLYSYSVEASNDAGMTEDGGAIAGASDAIGDGAAPVITTGPTAAPSPSSFSVDWTTDEASDSVCQWGTSSGSYPDSTSDAADVMSHSVTATGLTSNTTYYYRVCSTDPCGAGPTCSAEATVTTSGGCVPGALEHPVFINELHYDNVSTDSGEFVEIAGPAGTDLSLYTVELYNGNGGVLYDTIPMSGLIDDEGAGYGALSFLRAGIQNGAPDGLALIQGSTVVQFLCYEGTITATSGTALGLTCTDIGVQESSSTAIGESLQLKGGPGFVSEDFIWNSASADSPGSINAGQNLSCTAPPDPVQSFTTRATSNQVVLEWQDPAAYPAGGTTRICRDPASYPTDPATCTIAGVVVDQPGSGGAYGSYIDTSFLTNSLTYYYSIFVLDGSGQTSSRRTVSARPFDTTGPIKWSYHSSASSLAPPGLYPGAVGSGALFAVANDNTLHAMDPTSSGGGWPRTAPFNWRPMPMNGPAAQRPPVVPTTVGAANLVVFLGSEDGHAYAVDAHTGTTLWQSSPLATMITASVAGRFSTFGGIYDLLFVGSRDAVGANSLFGLDPATGSTLWTFANGVSDGGSGLSIGMISSGAAVDYTTDLVYFSSREHATGSTSTVWCLSFTGTGATLVWERALGDIDGGPVLLDGRLYIGNNNGEVYALDAATGISLWSFPYATAGGPVKGYVAPTFTALPRRLIFSTTNDVWALTDTGSGAVLDWVQPGVAGPSIPLSLGGTGIFVGSTDGRIHQLNETTGAVSSSLILGDGTATIGSPSYDGVNTMLSVGSESGALYSVTVPLP